jgi:hypothetical protein
MNLTTKNVGSNYLAKVVSLPKPYPHPNAQKLQLVSIEGNIVVTGLNAREGALYVYFPIETAINRDYLGWSNSFSDPLLNADKTKKGFFHDKGRVKAVKLRGQPSEGYIVPVEDIERWICEADSGKSLPFILGDMVGTEFDSINGILLCEKYVPVQQIKGPSKTPKTPKTVRHDRIVEGQFHFHVSTNQLKKNIHRINPEDTITITEKLHGTSIVCSKLLVNRKLKWYEKLLRKIGIKIQDKEYGLVYSSRNVIKNQYEVPKQFNHYYKEDIWGHAAKRLESALQDGISIYAEIVGYTPNGNCIQKGYDYGCKPGEFDVYVYRMTSTNASGKVIEFTTGQIKRYCDTHGLKMVPIHYHGMAVRWCPLFIDALDRDWNAEFLKSLTDDFLEKDCKLCVNKVPAEGVVVTVEKDQFQAYKLKSFAFFERESKVLDEGVADIETTGEDSEN